MGCCKPNKIWVDKGSKVYNRSIKFWLQDNNTEMYSTHNEGKSVVAERFIRTSQNKIYKHMIAASKNVYFDAHNNTYHSTIKMKPIDVNIILMLNIMLILMINILNLK